MKQLTCILSTLILLYINLQQIFFAQAQTNSKKSQDNITGSSTVLNYAMLNKTLKFSKERAHYISPFDFPEEYKEMVTLYIDKKYKKAIQKLEQWEKSKAVDIDFFALLGNSYDLNNQPEKAVETYKRGIERYETSFLYSHLAIALMGQKKYNEALAAFEKAIDITYLGKHNYYYWASKLLCSSNDPISGLIYGEISIVTDPGSEHNYELSKLMYDTYKRIITFNEKIPSVTIPNHDTQKTDTTSFNAIYIKVLTMSVAGETSFTLSSLKTIRKNFVTNYYNMGYDRTNPYPLFKHQQAVLQAGHNNAYNYWLFGAGDEAFTSAWVSQYKDNFKQFTDWAEKNEIQLNASPKLLHN